MALPSAVTIASAAFVVAAGVGYVAISTASADSPVTPAAGPPPSRHISSPATKPISTPQHSDPPAHPKPVVPSTLVVVFNNTGVTGLADQTATTLQDAGWHVAATDNWYGNIPEDTVYYPPDLRAEAGQLAKVLHITRLHPAVAPMQFDRLTVILASAL